MAQSEQSPPPIDVSSVLARCLNDASIVGKLLEKFRAHGPDMLSRISLALASKDSGQLAHLAHSFKGASATVSADRLRDLAAQLEAAGRRPESLEQLAGMVEQMQSELARCIAFIPQALGHARFAAGHAPPASLEKLP